MITDALIWPRSTRPRGRGRRPALPRLPRTGVLLAVAAICAAQAGVPVAAGTPAGAATAAASVRAASGSLLRPASRWHTYRDLRYSNAGRSASTSLDLYVPDNGAGQVPLIVWIHGGGWSAGSKDQDCVPRDKQLMARGFAVACINYRLTSEAVWPAQIIDVKAAIRTLRAQAPRYGLYADKIGLWGASAGGHLAAMAGAAADVPQWEVGPHRDVSSRVQAVIDDFGPSDLLAEVRDSSSPAVSVAQQVVINSLFGPAGGNRPQRRGASPVYWVDGDEPPFLLWHGAQDPAVPPSQSRGLYQRLRAAAVPAQLVVQPGVGHGGPQAYRPERIRMTAAFFDSWLRADS